MGGKELVKGYECLHCRKVLDASCKGHLPDVECVNYEERKEVDKDAERKKVFLVKTP